MALQTILHKVDFCVIGGGLSGLCAAISAARHGAKVALMHERPMLGGNCSSEIRMWVSGAHGDNNRETGLMEEFLLENHYRNPDKNYSVWDSILYEKARFEKNIILLLNCSCMDAEMKDGKIASITGWQMTTQQFHKVEADLFADCSGDSILAPLTGASFREGREAKAEYNETIPPDTADSHTMGLSCLLQAVETDEPHPYIAPAWAEKIDESKLIHRTPNMASPMENFWYLELGGTRDTIGETEEIRDELVALAYGMWDYLKNDPSQKARHENWQLDWVGMLPGKRESRRYVGAYTMTEHDVRAGGNFADEVAYGGWSMDDHHPAGFRTTEPPTIYHPAPSPYGIPFGSLYSLEIPNLMFAGRNISVTHAAMSSTRVMATCALLGQAIGTAAAMTVELGCTVNEIAKQHMTELQNRLMDDDCYLPHFQRKISALCQNARLSGDGLELEALRDGVDRPREGKAHAWLGTIGDQITYTFKEPVDLHRIRLVADSDLNRDSLPEPENRMARSMFHNRLKICQPSYVPKTLIKAFRITARFADGSERMIAEETANHNRLWRCAVELKDCVSITLTPLETWGYETVRLFAFEAE